VIGSLSNLDALVFFSDLDRFVVRCRFKGEQVVLGSIPSITLSISSFMVTFDPLSSSIVAAPLDVAFSMVGFPGTLAATFYFWIAVSSCPTTSGPHHSGS